MKVGGIEVVSRALDMRVDKRVAVWVDSFPPFNIAALPCGQLLQKKMIRLADLI